MYPIMNAPNSMTKITKIEIIQTNDTDTFQNIVSDDFEFIRWLNHNLFLKFN